MLTNIQTDRTEHPFIEHIRILSFRAALPSFGNATAVSIDIGKTVVPAVQHGQLVMVSVTVFVVDARIPALAVAENV